MIGGAASDFASAVDLFANDEAGEHMWKDEFAERPEEVGVVARVLSDAERTTDNDVNFAGVVEFFLKKLRELRRSDFATALVGNNDERVFGEFPCGEPKVEFFCLQKSKVKIKWFAAFFAVIFDEPVVFPAVLLAASDDMYHIYNFSKVWYNMQSYQRQRREQSSIMSPRLSLIM